jgi:uncharacterized protein YecT (DUF1311 family)
MINCTLGIYREGMTMIHRAVVALALLFATHAAGAQTAESGRCPAGLSNDACDQWHVERAEQSLAAAVERKAAEFDRRSTRPDRNEAARAALMEAQQEWLRFRTAECNAMAIANMISARTRQGLISACLLALTQRRIGEIEKY